MDLFVEIHLITSMLVALVLVVAYEPLPVLNVTCPATTLALSLDCSVLGIYSRRDCACLTLAGCDVPRCAVAGFTRDCVVHGDCVNKCICRDFLCSYEYTPQSTTDYWAKQQQAQKKYDERQRLIGVILGTVLVSPFLLLGLWLLTQIFQLRRARVVARPVVVVKLPDEGIVDD